jgi:hypothetical protein
LKACALKTDFVLGVGGGRLPCRKKKVLDAEGVGRMERRLERSGGERAAPKRGGFSGW